MRLIVHAHNGAQGDVVCPFPKAWVHEEVAFTMIGATVLDGIYLQPPLQPVLIKGESGTVIRHSVRSTTAADFAYRWSGSKFEYLIVLDELQWPIWISAQSITVHEPIGIVLSTCHMVLPIEASWESLHFRVTSRAKLLVESIPRSNLA